MMKPKAGQVWKFVDSVLETEEYIFITNVHLGRIQEVRFHFIENSNNDGWDYMSTFDDGIHYKLVSG